jgi:phosphatidylglycerophosphate synthase
MSEIVKQKRKIRRAPEARKAPSPAPVNIIERSFSPVLCVVGYEGPALWGIGTAERLKRQFAKDGIGEIVDAETAAARKGPVVMVRADAVLDPPLIPVLVKRANLLLMGEGLDGPAPIGAHVQGEQAAVLHDILVGRRQPGADLRLLQRSPADLNLGFWKGLRKRETPYAMAAGEANRAPVEWRMFMGTYKGATDLVTKHLWPVPAFHATRFLAPRGITPNMVTLAGAVLMVIAFVLFLKGYYLAGLAAAWAMTFLDTVDGKLARVTLTSSKWGDVFDHGLDLVHPPFWYFAWAQGLAASGIVWESSSYWAVIAAILGGYVLQRLIEGVAIKWLGLEIHIWRPIDTLFRQITARRNPNLVLLTIAALLGRPDWGLIAVAAWTVICLVLHAIQLAQAFAARRVEPLQSWMAKRP